MPRRFTAGFAPLQLGEGEDFPPRRAGEAQLDPAEGTEVGLDAVAVDPAGRPVGHRRVGVTEIFAAEIQLDLPVPVAAKEDRVAVAGRQFRFEVEALGMDGDARRFRRRGANAQERAAR
ncbi:MAG TPA: hypothetical protein VD741_03045 [Solirubrobacterales bacterium]|nr:hypothetical protein [Solirubrobacterales bacterium]